MRLGETSNTGADNGPLGVLGLAPMARSIIPPSPSITAGTPQLGPGAGLHTPASKARPPPPTPPTGATTSQQLAFAATTCPNTLTPCAVRLHRLHALYQALVVCGVPCTLWCTAPIFGAARYGRCPNCTTASRNNQPYVYFNQPTQAYREQNAQTSELKMKISCDAVHCKLVLATKFQDMKAEVKIRTSHLNTSHGVQRHYW